MCYNCGSTEPFIAECPNEIKKDRFNKGKKESKTDYKKSKRHMGGAHIGHEWDSTKDSSSEDEKIETMAIHKPPPHQGSSTCLMITTTPITFVLWQRVIR